MSLRINEDGDLSLRDRKSEALIDSKGQEQTLFANKSIQQLLAMKFPKNQFTIHLPSLKAAEREEKRKEKNK